ncbi:hypothetical protein LJC22_02420 [Desulfosarcina sp. OttesenSCG-928-G10]|nr:hypothetical protein [Desulfosarcina sp. OttesenSCG-928-G10]MDL2321134.1 hypothetical protein [Desulfosarcina sp. OttesenSCG-928-B08]
MKATIQGFSHGKLFITVFFLILLPDFILSLGGRDTFLFHAFPLLVDMGIAASMIMGVLIFIKLIDFLIENKRIEAICLCVGVLLFGLLCNALIAVLAEKSVAEAHLQIESFFINKGIATDATVQIEDDVSLLYRNYLTKNFSAADLQLVWKTPHLGIYEFKISPPNTQPFRVQLSTSQDKPNKIWIHPMQYPQDRKAAVWEKPTSSRCFLNPISCFQDIIRHDVYAS